MFEKEGLWKEYNKTGQLIKEVLFDKTGKIQKEVQLNN